MFTVGLDEDSRVYLSRPEGVLENNVVCGHDESPA